MEIRKVPITKIKSAPYNPRADLQPGDPEYEKLKRSIMEFGYVEPLVWNERTRNLVSALKFYWNKAIPKSKCLWLIWTKYARRR